MRALPEKTKQKVKAMYEPSGPANQSIARFPYYEATRGISTPSGRDASPLQGYPQH